MLDKYDNENLRYMELDDHMQALKASDMGKALVKMADDKKILISQDPTLPYGTQAAFFFSPRRWSGPGYIKYGTRGVNALLLAHELRHAWQYNTLPTELLAPDNAEEYIISKRMMEADARAVHMGCVLQIMKNLGPTHIYSQTLLSMILEYEKDIFNPVIHDIYAICNDDRKIKQVMRDVFDQWMVRLLSNNYGYDGQTGGELEYARKSQKFSTQKKFMKAAAPLLPNFTKKDKDPEFAKNLAAQLGQMPDGKGNYLTETKGYDFTHEFYMEVANIHLERISEKIGKKL